MLEFVPDHLKTKTICKNAVNKLSFLINYVLDRYDTQQMCFKVILKNGGILMFISDRYKEQNMYEKAVDIYPHALKSVPKKCVIGLSGLILLQYSLFLIDSSLTKSVIKLSILLYLILVLIDI